MRRSRFGEEQIIGILREQEVGGARLKCVGATGDLTPVHHRLRLFSPSRRGPKRPRALGRTRDLPVPVEERPLMPGPQTTPGRAGARAGAPARVAFRIRYRVGTRDEKSFAAQWPASMLPCRRFTACLAADSARLRADGGRYSFIVTDFHHLLLASLPAHTVQIRADAAATPSSTRNHRPPMIVVISGPIRQLRD